MKISTTLHDEPFRPVELQITIESQQELDALFCHFQYSPTNDFLRDNGVKADTIATHLKNNGAATGKMWGEYLKAVN